MIENSPEPKVGDAVMGSENDRFSGLVNHLDLMIRARYPLLYIVAAEEEPAEEVISQVGGLRAIKLIQQPL